MKKSRRRWARLSFIPLVLTLLGTGCPRPDMTIQTYEAPKLELTEEKPTAPEGLRWELPGGWTEQPNTSALRLASFSAAEADISLVILPGGAGGLSANVNRWRSQVGLPALSDEALPKHIFQDNGALGPFHWSKITNPSQPKSAILAAVFSRPEETIFVKLVGPASTLVDNQKKFLAFCRSLRQAGPAQ